MPKGTQIKIDVPAWQEEHRRLVASWEYAFAMSSDPQIRAHPSNIPILQRVRDLRALIAEHRAC